MYFFGLIIEALDSRRIIDTLKRYYVSHGMLFHYRTNMIVFTLQVYFARSDILCSFKTRSELLCCKIETSSDIGRKINYLQAKQRTCQNVQRLHHW